MSQKKQQDKNFLDVIFDFIFKGVQGDVKAIALREVHRPSSDNMAKGLEEVAKRPGVHANGEVLTAVYEAVHTTGITEQNTKTEKNAAKKLNLIRVPGTVTDQGVGAVVAKTVGASSNDAVRIGAVLGNDTIPRTERDSKARVITARTSAFELAKERKLGYDDANKLSQTFSSLLESSKIDLNEIKTIGEKIRIQTILGKKLKGFGIGNQDHVNELFEKYIHKAKIASKGKMHRGNWSLGALDKGITDDSEKPSEKLINVKSQELDSQDRLLESLGVDETDFRRKNLKQEMKLLKLWQTSDGSDMKPSKYWGSMYQNMSALNAMSLEGKVFGGILNGEAFDSKKNRFAPTERRKVVINGMEFEDMLVPKDEDNPIDAKLTSYYYRTPSSIARTLFTNGEGFVYSEYVKQAKIRQIIRGSESLYSFIENYEGSDFKELLGDINISNNQAQVLEALAMENKYIQLIKILERNKSRVLTDPNLTKVLEELQKLHKEVEKSPLLNYSFKLRKFSRKYSPIRVMRNIFSASILAILGKKLGEEALYAVSKLAINSQKSIRNLLGKTFGLNSLNTIITSFILASTGIIYFLGDKLLKPFARIALIFSSVSLFVFVILVFADASWVAKVFDTAGNTAPIFCEACGAGSIGSYNLALDFSSTPARNLDSSPVPSLDPDPNAQCPLGSSNSRCSQGPGGSFSHKGRNAIDVPGPPPEYWYAPSDGVITRAIWTYENPNVSGQLCGGIVHFRSKADGVTHMIVHVVPHVQANQSVTKGEPIAKIALASDGNINFIKGSVNSNTCATGAHFHLELFGTSIPADRYYRDNLNCNLGACP